MFGANAVTTTDGRRGGLETMTYLQRVTARLKALVVFVRPEVAASPEAPPATVRVDIDRFPLRTSGLSAIMRDNVVQFEKSKRQGLFREAERARLHASAGRPRSS